MPGQRWPGWVHHVAPERLGMSCSRGTVLCELRGPIEQPSAHARSIERGLTLDASDLGDATADATFTEPTACWRAELGEGVKHNWGARWATDMAGAWWRRPGRPCRSAAPRQEAGR